MQANKAVRIYEDNGVYTVEGAAILNSIELELKGALDSVFAAGYNVRDVQAMLHDAVNSIIIDKVLDE